MFMLVGPNGAGKSTLYEQRIKPIVSAPFINADHIQRDELNDPTLQAAYQAAEIAESRRQAHLAAGTSFVSESTFSHASKLQLIQDAKASGFRVVMYHVNVRNADLSVLRVAHRKREGGHDVPEDKIRERYERNQALIKTAVLQADRAFIYDNSTLNTPPALAIELRDGKAIWVSERVPAWARELYAKELDGTAR
ncbi:MAG TPA: AAA family ATPase [Burkholderiaceae bacterium]|nr:AAA family ATPase [Burkholderiaceae bacterium]